MKKLPVILTAAVAVALAAIVTVLGIRMKQQNKIEIADVTDYYGNTFASDTASEQNSETGSSWFLQDETITTEESTTEESTTEKQGFFRSIFGSDETTSAAATTGRTAEATSYSGETSVSSAVSKAVTTAVRKTTAATTKAVTTVSNTAFAQAFKIPASPKYIPPDVNVDFSTASLASYKYDPDGNYYYTDDKNAWQKGFGYNKIYDSLAIATAMYYDTVRTTFTYGGKDWLVQIWKGQYGYYFVGEEIGIYTKDKGSSSSTYACADKSDWLKMEMCFMWDENKTGDYEPIFTREYTDYWWCTGFVVGFESKASMTSRAQFRMVAHITFKDTEMAELFAAAFEKNGFKRASKIDTDDVDTFVQIGPDVGFVWQNINQNKI